MINPGSMPVVGADEQLAERNVDVFVTEARQRGAPLAGPPVRDPGADRDRRFGWELPMADQSVIGLLMPGTELIRVRDDLTALSPCLFLNGAPGGGPARSPWSPPPPDGRLHRGLPASPDDSRRSPWRVTDACTVAIATAGYTPCFWG